MDTIAPELVQRVRRNYILGIVLLAVSTVVAIWALVAEASSGMLAFPPGAYIFSPVYTLGTLAASWVGVIFWVTQTARLTRPGPQQHSFTVYLRMWTVQLVIGPIVLTSAALMIPGSLLVLQLGLTGIAFTVPIFCAAIVHLRALRLNKDILADRLGRPREHVPKPDVVGAASATGPVATPAEAPDSANGPAAPPQSTLAPASPIAPHLYLVVAAGLVGIHLVMEFILFTLYRDGMAVGGSLTGAYFAQGFMQFADIFVLSVFGVIVLVIAIINLIRGVPRRIGIATASLTALSLVLVPGQLAPTLSSWTGASPIDTSHLLEPQMALDSVHSYRIGHEPASNPSGYYEHDYVVDSLLHNFHYDMTVPMFADESGAVKWLQFDYPDQGSVCLFIGADIRDPADPAKLISVATLGDMAFFGDFVAGECEGERTEFDRAYFQ